MNSQGHQMVISLRSTVTVKMIYLSSISAPQSIYDRNLTIKSMEKEEGTLNKSRFRCIF